MDINKRSRSELKAFFVRKAVPSESNFAELIEGMINQKDDGLVKQAGSPLSVQAAGDEASEQRALSLYRTLADSSAEWTLGLNPRQNPGDAQTAKRGLSVSDSGGQSRLFIDHASGSVGVGTLTPQARLHVAGGASVDGDLRAGSLDVSGTVKLAGSVALTGSVTAPSNAWHALPMKTGWAWNGAPYYELEYTRDPFGTVRLRGSLKNTTAMAVGALVATLPEGFRPAAQSVHIAIANNAINRLDIKPNGDIVMGMALAVNLWISLDGITFAAAAAPTPAA